MCDGKCTCCQHNTEPDPNDKLQCWCSLLTLCSTLFYNKIQDQIFFLSRFRVTGYYNALS